MTECGYDATKVKALSREDYFSRVKELGQQRAAMLTCMTCSDTAKRWKAWEEEPRHAIEREVSWEISWGRDRGRGQLLRDELLVIADLVEENREEFEARLTAIAQRREWLEKKSAMSAAKKVPDPTRGRGL